EPGTRARNRRRRVAQSAGALHRAACARRRAGLRRPCRRRTGVACDRAAGRHREPDGRRRNHRHRDRDQEPARRLFGARHQRQCGERSAYLEVGRRLLEGAGAVIQLARQPLALAAHPTLGVSSVRELIATAKQRPGLGCATSGAGSNQHVLLEWFAQMANIKLDHVPYRGAGQAINDLIAGHVRVAFLGPTALIPHYKSGNLRLLAQSSETRSPNLPEVPTLQEAGFKGLVLETWYAAFVPLGTPPSAIARLN